MRYNTRHNVEVFETIQKSFQLPTSIQSPNLKQYTNGIRKKGRGQYDRMRIRRAVGKYLAN